MINAPKSVPMYVSEGAQGDWRVVDSVTGQLLSEGHPTVRTALDTILASVKPKSANLRNAGEADGVWRWLDATAVESEPIDGARIGEQGIWDMAASLNSRASSMPVNGGGAPEGLGLSESHGDATNGGDHLANGFVHVGVPVVRTGDSPDALHLFLYAELLPSIAAEVDRGRLAYGSVYFAFDDVNEDDNMSVTGAKLISHALTNDPAVTTLGAGSERTRAPAGTPKRSRAASRSEWRMTTMTKAERARQEAARLILVKEESVEGEELDTIAQSFLDLSREVLGKPEATMSEALAEMQARKEPMTKALAAPLEEEAVEPAAEPAPVAPPVDEEGKTRMPGEDDEDEDELDWQMMEEGKTRMPGEDDEDEDELDWQMMEAREGELDEDELEEELFKKKSRARRGYRSKRAQVKALRAELLVYETHEWLDAELRKQHKRLPRAKRVRYVEIAIRAGRPTVLEFLTDISAPPTKMPLEEEASRAHVNAPTTAAEAYDVCMEEAKVLAEADELKWADKQRRPPGKVARQVVRAKAQKLASQRFPGLCG